MSEFCPKCGLPLDTSGDDSRLCEACGWFGDYEETAKKPSDPEVFNPVLATLQALALYRDVCRDELIAEQIYDAGAATETDLRRVKLAARDSLHSLVAVFTALRRPHALPPVVLKKAENGTLGWPTEWMDYNYNCNECCDMLIGPCSCGAWHSETDEWVRETLARHNAVIQ